MGNQWWGKFYGIWVVAIPVVCFGLTYPIASFAEGNERHLMWPNLYVPSATLAHSGGAPYYIGLVGLFLFSSVVILLVLKHHEQIGLLAGDRYHEIQTRARLTLAVGLLAAFCVLLVGVFDLSRFFFIHTNVALGGFFGMVLFCLLSHLLFKQDVLAPYNKPKARYWRKILIWIAGISCLLMPATHGSYALREMDATKIMRGSAFRYLRVFHLSSLPNCRTIYDHFRRHYGWHSPSQIAIRHTDLYEVHEVQRLERRE